VCSAALKVEVLNSITPPREFEQGAPRLSALSNRRAGRTPHGGSSGSAVARAVSRGVTVAVLTQMLPSCAWLLVRARGCVRCGLCGLVSFAFTAGQAWIQYIASAPATVSEVIALQSKFDKLLEKHEARETGICPIREALYSQCFDELIRQETVFCAERGALFLRVRDELRMTLDSLQVAYQSSLAYGVRHAIECEQAKGTMEQQMRTLNETNDDLAAEVDELKARLVSQIAERTESRAQLEEEMAAEKEALLEEEKDLMAQLDEQMMQLGLKDRPPPPKEEKKEEGK
jgi:hypothetical protein